MFEDTSSRFIPSSQPRNPVVDTELMDLLDDRVETRKSAKTDFPIMKCFVISYSFPLRIDRNERGRVKMPEDIRYDCQVLIKSKVTRYFDIFPWYLVDIFAKNPKYYFYFVHPFQESSKLITFRCFLNQIWKIEFWLRNRHRRRSDFLEIRNFGPKVVPWLSVRPSTEGIKIGSTLKIEFSTHRKVMDEPYWCSAKLVTNFNFLFKKWLFVTTPVAFYVNFPKNHDFDDLDKGVMDILNLMCSNGPERWLGIQECLELGMKSSRSSLRSKCLSIICTGVYT